MSRTNTDDIKGALDTREDLERCMGEFAQARLALDGAKIEKEAALKAARGARSVFPRVSRAGIGHPGR